MPFDNPLERETDTAPIETSSTPVSDDPLITKFAELSPEMQKFFEQLAAGVQMQSGQEYLDWRKGLYTNSNYYGDTPAWRKLPVGMSGTLNNYISYTSQSWAKDPSQIEDRGLRQAVEAGAITAAQAAQMYWNNPNGRYFYTSDFGLKSLDSFGNVNEPNKSSGTSNGYLMASGTNTPVGFAGMTNEQGNAIALLQKTFDSYGLGTLAKAIVDMVKQGYAADTVSLLLQDTPEYKQRFAANDARRKAGMAVLSPAEYLATERAYRQIMNAAGLPAGFYDQQEDFTNLLSKDISPAELQGRVQTAADAVLNADPFYTQALRNMYGMSNGDMIAFVLNPDRSLPLIQQKANAVAFGAAAGRQGIGGIDNSTAELYGGMGVGKQQAEQGFAQIATTLPRASQLGQIYGQDYNQGDALAETFGNDMGAQQKRRKLIQSEADTFGGQSGVRSGSLGTSTQGLI